MKRNVCMVLAVMVCIFSVFSVTVYAESYDLSNTDMSITLNDARWYVFTRDNIENNAELEELGISYESMNNILQENSAYMDAILYYNDGNYIEFFVRKTAIDSDVANLSNYKNDKVQELAKELGKKQGAEDYSIYENEYKFVKLNYIDSKLGYHICEYVTVVNKDSYTFTFQATSEFTDAEYEEIEDIIDSIVFDIDSTIKEKGTSFFDSVIGKTILGAAGGAIVGLVIAVLGKKRKKRNETQNVSPDNAEGKEIDSLSFE